MARPRIRMLQPSVATANLSTAQPLPPPEASAYGQGRGGRPWRRKRDAVMKRDRFLCQPCKRAGRVTQGEQVDHVIPVTEGGTDDDTNLQTICAECHEPKSQAEAARAKARAAGRS